MGCFISTNSAAPPHISSSAQHHGGSKSPPPIDEETIKEVLAVAPRSTPPVSSSHGSERMQLHQNGGVARKSAASFSNEDPSDVDSEIHSTFSESFSTGNDGSLRWRPMLGGRSLPGELKKGKTAGRSRSGASPGRVKPGSGYSCKPSGRDRSQSGSGSSVKGLAAGKSKRKMGNYPGRVGYESGERIRRGKEEEEEREREEPPTNNELLESSLVSLECFIFL